MKIEKKKQILKRIKIYNNKPMSFYIKGFFDISSGRKEMIKLKKEKIIKIKKEGRLSIVSLTKLGEDEYKRLNEIP